MIYFHLGLKRRIKRPLIFLCKIKEFCANPYLMSTQMKKRRYLPYILLTWGVANLCITVMNQILIWI
jgi:hypothetical protein